MSEDQHSPGKRSRTSHNRAVRALRELRGIIRHLGDRLTCQQAVELVTDYLEGKMPAGERRRFERHLHACPGCTRYVDQVRLTADTLGHVHPPRPTADTREALLQVFRSFHRG